MIDEYYGKSYMKINAQAPEEFVVQFSASFNFAILATRNSLEGCETTPGNDWQRQYSGNLFDFCIRAFRETRPLVMGFLELNFCNSTST